MRIIEINTIEYLLYDLFALVYASMFITRNQPSLTEADKNMKTIGNIKYTALHPIDSPPVDPNAQPKVSREL